MALANVSMKHLVAREMTASGAAGVAINVAAQIDLKTREEEHETWKTKVTVCKAQRLVESSSAAETASIKPLENICEKSICWCCVEGVKTNEAIQTDEVNMKTEEEMKSRPLKLEEHDK